MDLIRNSRAARNCYFSERFRCNVCRMVVHDIYQRPCARAEVDCGLMKDWYGTPTRRDDAAQKFELSQVWHFVAAMVFLVGLFAFGWVRKGIGW